MSDRQKINLQIPREVHKLVKSRAPSRGLALWQAYAEGMTAWLEPGQPAYPETQEWHDRLEAVLVSDSEAGDCIRLALKIMGEAVRARGRPSRPAAKAR